MYISNRYSIDLTNNEREHIMQRDNNNVVKFAPSVCELTNHFHNFCCRVRELQELIILFDKEIYDEEYFFLCEDYREVLAACESLQNDLLERGVEQCEINMVIESSMIKCWKGHKWYQYLDHDKKEYHKEQWAKKHQEQPYIYLDIYG